MLWGASVLGACGRSAGGHEDPRRRLFVASVWATFLCVCQRLAVRSGDTHPVYSGEGKKEAYWKLFFWYSVRFLNHQDEEFVFPEGVWCQGLLSQGGCGETTHTWLFCLKKKKCHSCSDWVKELRRQSYQLLRLCTFILYTVIAYFFGCNLFCKVFFYFFFYNYYYFC